MTVSPLVEPDAHSCRCPGALLVGLRVRLRARLRTRRHPRRRHQALPPTCGPEEALRLIGIGFVGAIAAVAFDIGDAIATGSAFSIPDAIIDFLQGFFGGVLTEILVTRFLLDRTLAIIIAAFISGIVNALTTPPEVEPVPFPPVSDVRPECPFQACPYLSGRQ